MTECKIFARIEVSISDCRPLSIEKRFSFDWGRFILP
nr:MAG TPA: Ribosomal protein S17 [Caudoviricetes sp.]